MGLLLILYPNLASYITGGISAVIHNIFGSTTIYYIIAICLFWFQFRRDIKSSLNDLSEKQYISIGDKLNGLKTDLTTIMDNKYESLDNKLNNLDNHIKIYDQELNRKLEQQEKEQQRRWDELNRQTQDERESKRQEEELKYRNKQKEDFVVVAKLLAALLNRDNACSFHKIFLEAGTKTIEETTLQMFYSKIVDSEDALKDIINRYGSYDLALLREKMEKIISGLQKVSEDFGKYREFWNANFDRKKMDELLRDYEVFRSALKKYYANFNEPEWFAGNFHPLDIYWG